MFNLADIVQSAQGGQAIQSLAGQFGLSPDQAQQAVQTLLPALSAGLKTRASDPAGMGQVLNQVSNPQHQAAFQDPAAAQSDESQMAGQQALNGLFGGEGVVAAVAKRAADATGLSPELMQQMLPQVASIALGGVMTSMRNRGLGGAVDQLTQMANSGDLAGALGQAPANGAQGGGLGGLISGLVGSFLGSRTPQTDAASAGAPAASLGALTQTFEHGTAVSPQLEQDFTQLIAGR